MTASRSTDALLAALARITPGHAISRLTHRLARWESPRVQPLLRAFVRRYRLDMHEAQHPDVAFYPSFNALFTRALHADARPAPTDPDALVAPADARLAAMGRIDDEAIAATPRIHAKGHGYTLSALLAGHRDLIDTYRNGSFQTLYLSPRDYHRVHMPALGRLRTQIHVPGRLFSVAPRIVRQIPGLYARNERVICEFEGPCGRFCVILVGAINVGSIETVWAGEITPPTRRDVERVDFRDGDVQSVPELARGAELGRFNLGSSVILLFPPGRARLDPLEAETPVRVNQPIGTYRDAPADR